jgi:hypothetical protein
MMRTMPLVLISPANGETIPEGQMPTFKWSSAPKPNQLGARYTLRIVEVLDNQLPALAIKKNAVWFEKIDILTTIFAYPSSAKQLPAGQSYAWGIELNGVWSEIRFFSIPIKPLCKFLKADFVKASMGNCCCYKISLTNKLGITNINRPYSFDVSVNPISIVSSYMLANGWFQNPTPVPPPAHNIIWKTNGAIPTGKTDLAIICVDGGQKPSRIDYNWKNKKGQVICRDSVQLSCESLKPQCCNFNLNLINDGNNSNFPKYRRVIVTGIGDTKIIAADPDDWNQISNYPNSVTWYTGTVPLPAGDPLESFTIDNDFLLSLGPTSTGIKKLKVEWIDDNNNVINEQKIEIPCLPEDDYDFETVWENYTTILIGGNNVFAYMEPADCDEDFDIDTLECSVGDFDPKCNPHAGEKYLIKLNSATSGVNYNWTISIGTTVVKTISGNNQTTTLNPGDYSISLVVTDAQGGILCKSNKNLSLPYPAPDFTWKQRECGTIVDFDASVSNTGLVNIYEWKSNPSLSSGAIPPGVQTHADFGSAGIYDITLIFTDNKYGCKWYTTKTITVVTQCTPSFTNLYKCCENPESTKVISVSFINTSIGGICPIKYKWDFGDGQISYDKDPVHIYNGITTIAHPIVTLTMQDAANPQCIKTYSYTMTLKSRNGPSFDVKVCPDGKIICTTSEPNPQWVVPPFADVAPFPFTKKDKSRAIYKLEQSGQYDVTLISTDEYGNQCSSTKTITITIDCCAKHDKIIDHWYITVGSDDLRLKCKLKTKDSDRLFYLHLNVKAKTVLQKMNSKGKWRRYHSPDIKIGVGINGIVYRSENSQSDFDWFSGLSPLNGYFIGCNCFVPEPVSDYKENNGVRQVKVKERFDYGYRPRVKSITSNHYLWNYDSGGWQPYLPKQLQLGIEIEPDCCTNTKDWQEWEVCPEP